jgi:hypothetical protein
LFPLNRRGDRAILGRMRKLAWMAFQIAVVIGVVVVHYADTAERGAQAEPGLAIVTGVFMAFLLTLVPITLLNGWTWLLGWRSARRVSNPPHIREAERQYLSPSTALGLPRKLLKHPARPGISQ